MILIKFVVGFIICRSINGNKIHFLDQHNRVSLSQCVLKATNYFFTSNNDIWFFTSGAQETISFAGEFLKLFEGKILGALMVSSLAKFYTGYTKYYHRPNYIIETKSQGELLQVIEILNNLPSWNCHSAFLVVSLEAPKELSVTAKGYSQILCRKNVVKVVSLFPVKENNSLCQVYSWKPCQIDHGSVLPKDYYSFGKFHNTTSLLGRMFEKCSHDCTFKVHYIDWPPLVVKANLGFRSSNYDLSQGLDITLLNMIADKLNLTVLYHTTGTLWGKIHENGTVVGNLGLLLNNTVDILVGGYRQTADRLKYFDVTDSHTQMFEVWCVSNTPVTVGFRSMSNIFRMEVWIITILVYFFITACIYISSNCQEYELVTYKSFQHTLLTNVAVILGIGVNTLPRIASTRYFMSVLIIFGFYITSYYSGYLTSIISAPKYVQKYRTLEDIYNYKLKTYFMPDDIKWILNDSSVTSIVAPSVIQKRWKNCYNMSWCFEKVAKAKATSFYTDNLHKDYFLASGSYSMHCIQHNKIGTPIAIILRKGFPFYKQFNVIINRIIEAGIVVKWKKDLFTYKSLRSNNMSDASIKFDNLVPIFEFLLVGNSISLVVLLVEVIVKRSGAV